MDHLVLLSAIALELSQRDLVNDDHCDDECGGQRWDVAVNLFCVQKLL